MARQNQARVARQPQQRFHDVVETLCEAFHEYPVMRYILKDAGAAYDSQLRDLVAYFTDSRMSRGWPVLGIECSGELVAAANVSAPHPIPAPASLEDRFRKLREQLGAAAITRFQAFADACDSLNPAEPHYYLGMIGVRPQHQGRGYARLLLDAVHWMSGEDLGSTGVTLSTEVPANLRLYEHFGYRTLGEAAVEELVTWTMFRPDQR
jgi:ribosomal protein S18 acetylase RimI-like enzyme